MGNAIARGAKERLDELAVGILVAAFHELLEGLDAIRLLVIRPGQVEWPDRVMRWANHVQTLKSMMQVTDRIRQRRGFGRGHLLADAAEAVESWRPQFVRARCLRGRGNDHHLFGTCGSRLFEQSPDAGRTIRQAMRFAPPTAQSRRG